MLKNVEKGAQRSTGQPFRVGDWRVDPRRDLIRLGAARVSLRPKVMDMLVLLAGRPGEIFTVSELLRGLWPDTITTPASVYNCLKELRAALQDDPHAPRYIETIPKRGYRLVAPVHFPGPPGTAGATDPRPSTWLDRVASVVGVRPNTVLLLTVALTAILAVSAIQLWQSQHGSEAATGDSPKRTLAVLPFQDLDDASGRSYLADGVARGIIDDVAAGSGLRVIGDSSSFRAWPAGADLQSIAERLNADFLLEGSVARRAGEFQVSTRITDARNGGLVWHKEYRLPLDDLAELSRLVGNEVVAELEPGDATRGDLPANLGVPRQLDNRAYDLYLQARSLANEGNKDALIKAIDLLNEAVAVEPALARARVFSLESRLTLYWAHQERFKEREVSSLREHDAYRNSLLDEAQRLADQYPDLAEAQMVLGKVLRFAHRSQEAEAALLRALELNASLGEVHRQLGWINHHRGDSWSVSIRYFREAILLEPFSLEARTTLVRALANVSQRRDEMWAVIEYAKTQFPQSAVTSYAEALALESEGRYADAIRVLEHALEREEHPRLRSKLAWAWYALDQPERSRQLQAGFETWRDQPGDPEISATNRCPGDPATIEPELLPWAAYVCVTQRKWRQSLRVLALTFASPEDLAESPVNFLGTEWSVAISMATALEREGRSDEARPYLALERALLEGRTENGALTSGASAYLWARVHALQGEPAKALEQLDRMLRLGDFNPVRLRNPAFDSIRETRAFRELEARRQALVGAELAKLGLVADGGLALRANKQSSWRQSGH